MDVLVKPLTKTTITAYLGCANMVEPMAIIGPLLGISMLAYAGYCTANGGTHVRGKGWVAKGAMPKSFYANQIMWTVFGISLIFGSLIRGFFS